MNLNKIICPGCGWIGFIRELGAYNSCPLCGYENETETGRLLTINEMLKSDEQYNDVRLDLFLKSLFKELGIDELI